MSKVFISYRRADSQSIIGRIYDHLAEAFGQDNIFLDVEKIPPGVDFREYIRSTLMTCNVMLVVIGSRQWAFATNERGRRLSQPDDPIRVEIELGLQLQAQRRLVVIPILIDEAQIPAASDLPPSLEQLIYLNAAPVHTNQYFKYDINNLINSIAATGMPRVTSGPIEKPHEFYKQRYGRAAGIAVGGAFAVYLSIFLVVALVIGGTAFAIIHSGFFSGGSGLPGFQTLHPITVNGPSNLVGCHSGSFQAQLVNDNSATVNWAVDDTGIDKSGGQAWATVVPENGSIDKGQSVSLTVKLSPNICNNLGPHKIPIKTINPKDNSTVGEEDIIANIDPQ